MTLFITFISVLLLIIGICKGVSKIRAIYRKRCEEKVRTIMREFGFDYDNNQDIFYSMENAWQKTYGYCRLYDEAALFFRMVIDFEPIYFEYDNKKWLIEFWKGQYLFSTGAEVGIYYSDKDEMRTESGFRFTFYDAIEDKSYIKSKFSLSKNDKKLFEREDSYWWITGFVAGEYSEPEELSMDIVMTFKDEEMTRAFLEGAKNAGYSDEELRIEGSCVYMIFEEPHTIQPYTRIDRMERIQQAQNRILSDKYKLLISPELNSFENLVNLKASHSRVFKDIVKLLSNNRFKEVYRSIEKFIK